MEQILIKYAVDYPGERLLIAVDDIIYEAKIDWKSEDVEMLIQCLYKHNIAADRINLICGYVVDFLSGKRDIDVVLV